MDAIGGAGTSSLAQTLQSRQDFTTTAIKQQAESEQQIAEAVSEAAESGETLAQGKTRGQIVDIKV